MRSVAYLLSTSVMHCFRRSGLTDDQAEGINSNGRVDDLWRASWGQMLTPTLATVPSDVKRRRMSSIVGGCPRPFKTSSTSAADDEDFGSSSVVVVVTVVVGRAAVVMVVVGRAAVVDSGRGAAAVVVVVGCVAADGCCCCCADDDDVGDPSRTSAIGNTNGSVTITSAARADEGSRKRPLAFRKATKSTYRTLSR